MPDLLTIDGELVLDAGGDLVATDAPEDCECCGEPTCERCAAEGDAPALVCPERTGQVVSVAGITLTTSVEFLSGTTVTVTWDGGNTIAGEFCLYADVCGTRFISLAPVKTGTTASGDPVRLFLALNYQCGVETEGVSDPPGPGNPNPYLEAYLVGSVFDSTAAEGNDAVAFTTLDDVNGAGADTFVAAARACSIAGYTIPNAATTHGPSTVITGMTTIGTGGTIETLGECTNVPCGTATVSAVAIDFFGGPLDGLSLDASGEGLPFDDGRYHGAITLAAYTLLLSYGAFPSFRLQVRDREASDAVVFEGWLICDGAVNAMLGEYHTDPLSPFGTTYAVVS